MSELNGNAMQHILDKLVSIEDKMEKRFNEVNSRLDKIDTSLQQIKDYIPFDANRDIIK